MQTTTAGSRTNDTPITTPYFQTALVTTSGGRNDVTFAVESVMVVKDRLGRTLHSAVHCASCMGEHTFSPDNLFIANTYEFTPVFWDNGDLTCFRDTVYHLPNRRKHSPRPLDAWGAPHFHIDWKRAEAIEASEARKLNGPINGYVVVEADLLGGAAIEIHFPVKTLSVAPQGSDISYQVSTGPVIVPAPKCNGNICVDLAFIAFTNTSNIEFMRKDKVVPLSRRNPLFYRILVAVVPSFDRVFSVSAFSQIEKIRGRCQLVRAA